QLPGGSRQVATVGRADRGTVGELSSPDAAEPLGLGHPFPERKRLIIVPGRLRRGSQPFSLPAGSNRGGERAGYVMTGQVVVREFGGGAGNLAEALVVGEQI